MNTRSPGSRIAFSLFVILVTIPAIYRSYQIFRSDRIVKTEQTYDSYTRALKIDPSDSLLWWNRGRLSHYSMSRVDISQAIEDYGIALRLNPRLGLAWVDLADCYERRQQYEQAEEALQKALAIRTYSPTIRWQAGNYYLRRGNLARMYESFRLACEYDLTKLAIALETAWKADPDHAGILGKLVPDNLSTNLQYLRFLVNRDELDLARAAWNRILQNDIPPSFEYRVSLAFDYVDLLLAKNRTREAQQVWADALQKADREVQLFLDAPQETPAANLVWNGSFESELLRGGLDWRFTDVPEIRFQTDLDKRMEGLKSLKITFGGSNIAFSHLSQIVPVPTPGPYVFEFYARTEDLTSDQTPYMVIQSYPDTQQTTLRTDSVPHSTGWRKYSIPFSVAKNCKAVRVTLRRASSSKFDNQIKGFLWLDGVSIQPASLLGTSRRTE